jgi:polyisoprenoid-binding protein YceI
MPEAKRKHRRLRWWLVGGIVVIILLAVGLPFVYIHFIEGPPPPKLALPKLGSTSTTVATSTGRADSAGSHGSATGVWHVGPGSVVGYRVQEVLIGQNSTAVGRTTDVSGSLQITGTTVASGSFAVNMASVKSDQSERNAQFDGRIMDVAAYPTAKLVLTQPIDLAPLASVGQTKKYMATGDLTMHGVTKSVTFPVAAERTAGSIYILADVDIVFADWHIDNPSVGGFVTTASTGTLEVLLRLSQTAANPTVPAQSSTGGGGGLGGPVTVPKTTVPTLTIPPKS